MAIYRISGIWKRDNVITHYGIHTVSATGTSRAVKTSKAAAILLVENNSNTVTTWIWNYTSMFWVVGSTVNVVGIGTNKYLRTTQDNTVRDNLGHLINYDWVIA
jgi:hypothetical protein